MKELDWTGERLVTSLANIHGKIEHLHRYALALELARNNKVLDIACGEGYGSNLLSSVADTVIGVDISEETIRHASKKYVKDNLIFRIGSTSNIPLESNSIDLVVSFETIEHHDEHEKMMLEIKRVLTPKGLMIISSPEKTIYKTRDPNNPYHIKELTLDELKLLLQSYFTNIKLFDQKFIFGSLINEIGITSKFEFYDGDFNGISNKIECDEFYNRSFFNLAIVSDSIIPDIPGVSIFNGLSVLKHENKIYEDIIKNNNMTIHNLKKSYSYLIGNILLKPFSFMKKMFF